MKPQRWACWNGVSGGEPLARHDLVELVGAARDAKLYTNLITSGIGLDDDRVRALRDAGLDSVQLSFQSDESDLSDQIAGARAHQRKLNVAQKIRAAGIPLSLNFVIHRRNIDRLPQMIDLAETLGAGRVRAGQCAILRLGVSRSRGVAANSGTSRSRARSRHRSQSAARR